MNVITPLNLTTICCNFTESKFPISKFQPGLIPTTVLPFLNFQSSLKSNGLVNAITPQKLHASCCNFTEMSSTPRYQRC